MEVLMEVLIWKSLHVTLSILRMEVVIWNTLYQDSSSPGEACVLAAFHWRIAEKLMEDLIDD